MSRRRRLLVGAVCVETVAAVAIVRYGALSLVAVLLVYWLDLCCLAARSTVQRLIARPTASRGGAVQVGLMPFRLLRHKRGAVSVTDRLPPVYLRNLPESLGGPFVIAISTLSTAAVAVVHVPGSFWRDPVTPLVLAAGGLAAVTKAWLALQAHVAAGVHETRPGRATVPTKRLLLYVVYAGVVYAAIEGTAGLVVENDPATASVGLGFWAVVLVGLRLGYSVRASRTRFDGGDTDTRPAEEGVFARLRELFGGAAETVVLSPPSTPDGEPVVTVGPRRVSLLAAGVVNALTTGGVVDGKFSGRGLHMRVGVALILGSGLFPLFDGAVELFAVLWGSSLAIGVAFAAVSIIHVTLSLGAVEYRFYDGELVAYDGRLGEPQWAVPYDQIETVTVDRGLFGSPLWLDAGTVSFERTDSPPEDDLPTRDPRASIPFVADPERVRDTLQSRRRAVRGHTDHPSWTTTAE